MFKLDMHSHTRGSDGTSTPAQIAQNVRDAGLDGICLTDHHCNTPEDNAEVYRVAEAVEALGLKAFIGVEYSTAEGHLLVFGIDVPRYAWGEYPPMQAVIDDVNAMGGACVAAHPYKGYTRSLKDRLLEVKGLAAVEGLNGQCEVKKDGNNEKAQDAAVAMDLPCTGGSDAHWASAIGTVWTVFDRAIEDEHDLVAALLEGNFRPQRGPRLEAAQEARRAKLTAPQPIRQPFPPVSVYEANALHAARRSYSVEYFDKGLGVWMRGQKLKSCRNCFTDYAHGETVFDSRGYCEWCEMQYPARGERR